MLGASPAAACQKLEITLDDVAMTFDVEPAFEARCRKIHEALDENVKAALYQSAMKGTVAAQTLWMRLAQTPATSKRSRGEEHVEPLSTAELRERLLREMALFQSRDADRGSRTRAPDSNP